MKIAFLLYKYFPYGGLQRDCLKIAEIVRDRGHEVWMYARSWQGDKPEGIHIIEISTSSMTNQGKNCQYYRAVQQHLQKNSVDCVIGFNKMPGLDYYYAADECYADRIKQRSFIYKILPRTRFNLAYEREVFASGKKTKLLMLTEYQIKAFKENYGTEDSRFALLPPGAPRISLLETERAAIRQKVRDRYHLKQDDLMLLQVGSDFQRKGLDRSIRAIASLPEVVRARVRFFVIGSDKETSFKRLADELNVGNQITFLGGRKDVLDFMVASDLFLHPARKEAAGIVLVEALASRLPEIVTENCGYSPHIRDSRAGIVLASPFSQYVFNEALKTLLIAPEKLNSLSLKAEQYVSNVDIYSLHNKVADIITQKK